MSADSRSYSDTEQVVQEDHHPLCDAAYNGDLEEVRRLVESGHCINEIDMRTPLMWATAMGAKDIVTYLIQRGANLSMVDYAGRTAAMYAAMSGNFDILRILLKSGASPNTVETPCELYQGATALMWAIENKKIDCVRLLLAYGADIGIKDKEGRTAKDYALIGKKKQISELLEREETERKKGEIWL